MEGHYFAIYQSPHRLLYKAFGLQSSSILTRGTCDIIGGYFEATAGEVLLSTVGTCYYNSFHCPGYLYLDQCYANRSSSLSCSTCENIDGVFRTSYGCYYYTNNCRFLSAGGQCHTDMYCNLLFLVDYCDLVLKSICPKVGVLDFGLFRLFHIFISLHGVR